MRGGVLFGVSCALVIVISDPVLAIQSGYLGISETNVTGSTDIDVTELVVAFDMSTRTPTGKLRDFGPLHNHGAISGTTSATGVRGQAMRFRVPTDRVHLSENESFAIDGPISIALWVRVETLGLHQHILACDDKFALWVTPQNRVRFSDTLGHGMDSDAPVTAGRWYSLIAIFDGTYGDEVTPQSTRLYLNGTQVETQIVNRTGDVPVRWVPGQLYSHDACYVGFESHQGNEAHQDLQFDGIIDELMIFRRALSDSEIESFSTRR